MQSTKYCIDCKWHTNGPMGSHICMRPTGISLVTGKEQFKEEFCSTERDGSGGCGIGGYYFEPKENTDVAF